MPRLPNRSRWARPRVGSKAARRSRGSTLGAPAWRSRLLLVLLVAWTARLDAVAGVKPRAVERGRDLYFEQCARCHGREGRGGGPDAGQFDVPPADLRDRELWIANSDEQMVQRIREGSQHRLKPSKVQDLPAQTPRTEALASYLRRLPSVDWRRVDAGKRIYLGRCAACHGWYGGGGSDPAVKAMEDFAGGRKRSAVDDRRLAQLARHGGPDQPRLSPPLEEGESIEVASFLRLLSPGYEIYERYCSVCHGAHGETPWLVFDRAYFRKLAPGELRERVWHMLRGAQPTMPHFRDTLSAADVQAIVGYLRSLSPEDQ